MTIIDDLPDLVVLVQSQEDPGRRIQLERARYSRVPLVFVSTAGSEQLAVAAFRAGAADYLTWPATPVEVVATLARVGRQAPRFQPTPEGILAGDSPSMRDVCARIRHLASTPCNVLISGETGTGKELAARMLHRLSQRACGPFVSINCAAVPESLFESELFGFERGAFTGATAASAGKLRSADGGTVFLDEVGELSVGAQPKLLRAIEQREVQSLGGGRAVTVDVRWVAATNRDLTAMARDGRFRLDLLYRLNVCTVSIAPLRERREDIGALAAAFLVELRPRYGRPSAHFTRDALAKLESHQWPGNVRELRNVVESSLILAPDDYIDSSALPQCFHIATAVSAPSAQASEFQRVVEALRAAKGNKSEAAHRLRWSRMTLYRKIARYRIDVAAACDSVTPPVSQV